MTLALGKKVSKAGAAVQDDPFKTKDGGLVDMKSAKGMKPKDSAFDVVTQFSKETHVRDEDDEMRKYVETQMEKIKGGRKVSWNFFTLSCSYTYLVYLPD